jgi:HTH domain
MPAHDVRRWPLVLIAAPAAVAVWSGWVGLGSLCGFGIVHPLPGIADSFKLNTAITLPVGVEAYGAYALGAWLTPGTDEKARRFARRSALGALALGMAGQVIYHLLAATHASHAPWPVVVLVSCLPVLTLGMGAALTHLLRTEPMADASADPDTAPYTAPAANSDAAPARPVATRPDRTRSPRRSGTGAAVARLRSRNPSLSTAEIARRLGVSDRTVRRHLAAHPANPTRPDLPSAA